MDTGNNPGGQEGNYTPAAMLRAVGLIPKMSDQRLAPHVSPLVREIYRRMTEAGLTATTLAAKVGRNESYFRDLFRGRSRAPSADYLPAIAAALDCEVTDLVHPGESGSEPSTHGDIYQPDEVALIGFWRVLSDAGKHRVMRAIIREANRAIRGEPENGVS